MSPAALVLGNCSTNTAENIRFTLAALARDPVAAKALWRVVLVANPSRQRRVALTWRQLVPQGEAWSVPPVTTLAEKRSVFHRHGQSLEQQMSGEVSG